MVISLALGYEDMPLQASIGLRALALGRPKHLFDFLYSIMVVIVKKFEDTKIPSYRVQLPLRQRVTKASD